MASQYIGKLAPAPVTHKYIPIYYGSPKWITFDRFLLATLGSRGKVCFEIGNHILTKLVARHLWNLECIIGLILGNKEGMLQTISYPNLVTPEFCLYFCQLHLLVCLIVCSKNTITSLDNWAWYLNLNIAVKHLVYRVRQSLRNPSRWQYWETLSKRRKDKSKDVNICRAEDSTVEFLLRTASSQNQYLLKSTKKTTNIDGNAVLQFLLRTALYQPFCLALLL